MESVSPDHTTGTGAPRQPSRSGVVDALRAICAGDRAEAVRILTTQPVETLLSRELRSFLAADRDTEVYDAPVAFEAFIRGGGNIGLYDAVSAALARSYADGRVRTLADLGCGDGRALIPALRAHPAERVALVEPSASLLDIAYTTAHSVLTQDVQLTRHPTTTQDFAAALTAADRFDLIQSTFSLHTLPPGERNDALVALREHTDTLVIVEFDVPEFDTGSPEQLAFLADTYEVGLAEYEQDGPLVAQGFLMPVLVGQLAPGAQRMTYEQSAAGWVRQVREAGYRTVTAEPLFPYWSAPAFLLVAKP